MANSDRIPSLFSYFKMLFLLNIMKINLFFKCAYRLPRRILATRRPFYVQTPFEMTPKGSKNDLKIEGFGVVVGWYEGFLKIWCLPPDGARTPV